MQSVDKLGDNPVHTMLVLLSMVFTVGTAVSGSPTQASQPANNPATNIVTLNVGDKVTLKLAYIPAGTFLMGSPAAEQHRFKDGFKDETQHEVTISKPFYMGICLVTQEQYQQLMGKNPSKFKAPLNPVENLTWDDAVEFCKALSARTGKSLRLPTEAQWEYACRAGSTTAYCNGDTPEDLKAVGWCSYDGKWGSAKAPKPVGSLQPNAWGLYDMHGNLWEYCADWYAADSYANTKRSDPQGPDTGTHRVVRGGPWNDYPRDCRSAKREKRTPSSKSFSGGFRVVLDEN
ncbi:MAG: formylglycine-generating enzyme family protein [Verrucomicrobiota bacterium]